MSYGEQQFERRHAGFDEIESLCRVILDEAVRQGYGDLLAPSYNPEFRVEIPVSIADLRRFAHLAGWKPTARELKVSAKAREWQHYIDELDEGDDDSV